MNKRIYLLLILLAVLACGRTGVDPQTDPTNEDAIYNIIRYDSPAAFNLDLIDQSAPDTTLAMSASYQPLQWWRHIDHDSLDIDIQIRYPEATDSIGTVPQATVRVVKYFWGKIEIIAADTTGEVWRRVRLSKPFAMKGTINAFFEKYGFDYNTRRGWRLTQLSDAVFIPQVGQVAAPQIVIHKSDVVIQINPGLKLLRNLPQFSVGDSVTLSITRGDTTGVVELRYPWGNGLATQEASHTGGGTYAAGFRFPRNEDYGHFLVDALPLSAIADTIRYLPNAIGVIYRIR